MKTLKSIQLALGTLVMMCFITLPATAQTFTVSKTGSVIKVDGTSNVHDWTITSEAFQGSLTAILEDGKLVKLEKLEFTVPAESLKSGKGGMDKNTYKALNQNPQEYHLYPGESKKPGLHLSRAVQDKHQRLFNHCRYQKAGGCNF